MERKIVHAAVALQKRQAGQIVKNPAGQLGHCILHKRPSEQRRDILWLNGGHMPRAQHSMLSFAADYG